MAPPDNHLLLTMESAEEERTDVREVHLERGRTLTIASDGTNELIEIRASSGDLELRIQMTENGPVLKLEGVKLSLKATEAIEMECKTFSVDASEKVELVSQGTLQVSSEGEMNIDSTADVRVRGEKIYLN